MAHPLRLTVLSRPALPVSCSCCHAVGLWDRIGQSAVCPDCQEKLIQGSSGFLREKLCLGRCVLCDDHRILSYVTIPRQNRKDAGIFLEIDICARHLRFLLRRSLARKDFVALREYLSAVGLKVDDVFLLHGALYDDNGKALNPVRME